MTSPLNIAFALYPNLTQLDFTGPYEVFQRLPGARLAVASRRCADSGKRRATSRRCARVSLLLAAAGLLEGKRAACHWAWRELLAESGVQVESARVVRDGNCITGGGVTAGIDFALTVVAEIAGAEVAQVIQLMIEYAPSPPFSAGSPESAPPAVLARVREQALRLRDERRAALHAALAARR